MSNDPLALSEIWAGLPQPQASRCRDLIELATAINRVKAEIAASEVREPTGLAAAERLQDIAFALRERDVDAALCDALDAAIREISLACALNDATAERTRKAGDLLRDLAGRIIDMIALWIASDRAQLPAAEAAAAASVAAEPQAAIPEEARAEEMIDRDAPPHFAFFATEVVAGENFARAIAALAASLPTLADSSEPEPDRHYEPAEAVFSPAHSEDKPEPPPAEPVTDLVGEGAADAVVVSDPLPYEMASESIEPLQIEPPAIEPQPIDAVEAAQIDRELNAATATMLVSEQTAEHIPDDVPAIDEPQNAAAADVACDGQMAAREAALPQNDALADAGGFAEPSSDALSNEGFSGEALSPEPLSNWDLPSAEILNERASDETSSFEILSEDVSSEDSLAVEPSSEEMLVAEESSAASSGEVGDTAAATASVEASLAGDADSEARHPAVAEALNPTLQVEAELPAAIETVEARSAEHGEPFLESGLSHPLPPKLPPPSGPEDDPGDLFEPLPLPSPFSSPVEETIAVVEPEAPRAVAAEPEQSERTTDTETTDQAILAAEPLAPAGVPAPPIPAPGDESEESTQSVVSASESNETDQIASAEAPVPDISPPAPADVPPVTQASSPQPRIVANPVAPGARPIARPAPSDPLMALRALSEEETIALFS